jgi:hypothetical protein
LKNAIPVAVLCAVLFLQGAPSVQAQADEAAIVAIIWERAAAHGQSGAAMERIARCESRLNPNAVGDRGQSHGLFQIHNAGLLSLFRQWGYDDRTDPWQASDFTARALAAGLRRHWNC